MNEMMSLMEEYANQRTPERMLLRKESVIPTTRFVNSITIVHTDNEKVETPTEQTVEEPPKSQSLSYYLKHDINENTITNWIKGDERNQSSKQGSEKEEGGKDEYDTLPGGQYSRNYWYKKWLLSRWHVGTLRYQLASGI